MPKQKKLWSRMVEESGVRVRLFSRDGSRMIWYSIVKRREEYTDASGRVKRRTVKVEKSLETTSRGLAEERARELAAKIAEARLTGVRADTLTLGQLFDQYRRHKLPILSGAWARSATTRATLFLEAWGRELNVADIDHTRVALYCRKRRNLEVVSPGLEPDADGARRRGYREPQPVGDGALNAELRWLNSALNWACEFKTSGRSLLDRNPLPTNTTKRREIGWPTERNPRRPIASHERYTATMSHADDVDDAGRLRCILSLARFTGRREAAICKLWASDVLLSEDRIRATLAAEGMDERLAEHMPHGALRWRAETDKQGLLFVTPISADTRAELDIYLRGSPRVGDVPLFPAPRDPSKPIRRETAAKWLLRAERLAGQPKVKGGVFHPYRRLFASERRGLPDVDVAAAAGWKDPATMKKSYQQADAAGVLSAVLGRSE